MYREIDTVVFILELHDWLDSQNGADNSRW